MALTKMKLVLTTKHRAIRLGTEADNTNIRTILWEQLGVQAVVIVL